VADNKGPRANITVEETYRYDVELGVTSQVAWLDGAGQVRIQVPYDGTGIRELPTTQASQHLGELHLTFPASTDSPLILPVDLIAGPALPDLVRSGKRAVLGADYQIPAPRETLVVVDGEVFDRDGKELSVKGLDPFRNPLYLRLSLWVPDLWSRITADESHELAVLLMQGENEGCILMPYSDAVAAGRAALTRNLAALANASGGLIIVGVDAGREIHGLPDGSPATRLHFESALLAAALRCSPPVRFGPPRYVKMDDSKVVVQLAVPAGAPAKPRPLPASGAGVGNFVDMTDDQGHTRLHNAADVVLLSAGGGIERLDLGRHICGLLNSTAGHGRIVITDLPAPAGRPLLSTRRKSLAQQLEAQVTSEVERLLPRPAHPSLQFVQVDGNLAAVLMVARDSSPVTLYQEVAYVWEEAGMSSLSPREALRRYLAHTGYADLGASGEGSVRLEYARLRRPMTPPESLEPDIEGEWTAADELDGDGVRVNAKFHYESQLHAQVWKPCAFQYQPRAGGFALQLVLPLRSISLATHEDGSVAPALSATAAGEIMWILDDVLASGIQVVRHAADADSAASDSDVWLERVPISKQTRLRLQFRAELRDLFQRRTKTAVLDFHVPDVTLDPDRVDDLVQACADLGFRIYQVDAPKADADDPARSQARIRGIRSQGYADIHLLLVVFCTRSPVTRELRYEEQRIDNKQTYTSAFHLVLALWGTGSVGQTGMMAAPDLLDEPAEALANTGDRVSQAMAQTQFALHQTVNRRFLHLRTE
jgi:hypothetical protein